MKCYYYYNSSLLPHRKNGKFVSIKNLPQSELNRGILAEKERSVPVIKRSKPVIVSTEEQLDKFFLRVFTLRVRDRFARATFDFPRYLDALRAGRECH
jgi:hypothetical protein